MDRYLPEVLLRDLVRHERQPSAFLLYFYLWHRTGGHTRRSVALSLQQLSTQTGRSRRTLQNARALLVRRKLIDIHQPTPTATPAYRILKPWLR